MLAGIGGCLLAAVLAVVLIVDPTGAGNRSRARTPITPGRQSTAAAPIGLGRSITIEDPPYHGVWALSARTATALQPHSRRPANGREWLAEGTKVWAICVRAGDSYGVLAHGALERWRWWVHLGNAAWVPVAAIEDARHDGPQGFKAC